jgi:hypothetical protein
MVTVMVLAEWMCFDPDLRLWCYMVTVMVLKRNGHDVTLYYTVVTW